MDDIDRLLVIRGRALREAAKRYRRAYTPRRRLARWPGDATTWALAALGAGGFAAVALLSLALG